MWSNQRALQWSEQSFLLQQDPLSAVWRARLEAQSRKISEVLCRKYYGINGCNTIARWYFQRQLLQPIPSPPTCPSVRPLCCSPRSVLCCPSLILPGLWPVFHPKTKSAGTSQFQTPYGEITGGGISTTQGPYKGVTPYIYKGVTPSQIWLQPYERTLGMPWRPKPPSQSWPKSLAHRIKSKYNGAAF